ncbi:MAG: aminopeptidase N [Dehalococcoidia bacterium]
MTASPVAPRDVLTQIEAEARAGRVSNVSYDIDLSLTRNAETYRGDVTVRFDLAGDGDTFLDFRGKTIELLEVNGTAIEALSWTGYRLTLPGEHLAAGSNVVHVVYENEYDHTGDGLHQFVDPEDGEEYLYTNFEPYESHRLFPQFDQPDIKARYRLVVSAPEAWEIIANSRETASEATSDGRTRHTYEETAPFSTYLFAMIAGPYHVFRDEHGGVPLGFFCRRSLVKHVDTDELFEVTKQGLDFYASFFDYPYPFTKYDQIFVPEFNAGAMENVGAVTHSERLVFRDPPTDTQRLSRAEVLLHEMAHMWFGNLVTMRWWNDLWLNESFATYMAYLSLVEATRFKTAWQAFNSGMKNWAYRQDQLVTTHPIAGEVADTDQTFLNFDGITYGKGAAVIKQLVAAMGIDGFRDGMRRYFKRHEFSNTTLSQFLDALGEGVGRDLHEWARAWLETPSLNTVAASWETDGDRLSSFALTQTAPEAYPTLRPHHLEVALVRGVEGGAPAVEALDVDLAGESVEVSEAVGRPAPDFVFPNHNDHGFAKVALDEASLAWLRDHLGTIEDPLLRQLVWQTLWQMTRDQQLRSTEYLELAAANAPDERDTELIETILATATATIGRYVPEDQRIPSAHRFFEAARDALQTAPQGDLQIIWGRAMIGSAITPEDIQYCGRLVDGEISVPGFNVDQDMRWDIASRYVAYGLHGAEARVVAERQRDPSDRGQRAGLRCETAVPTAEVKAEAWRRFNEEGYGSLHLTAAAMSGFHWRVQRELLEPYVERYFESVRGIFRDRDHEFARSYFGALFPGYIVERGLLDRCQALLDELTPDEARLARSVREAMDDLERAIKCREFASS